MTENNSTEHSKTVGDLQWLIDSDAYDAANVALEQIEHLCEILMDEIEIAKSGRLMTLSVLARQRCSAAQEALDKATAYREPAPA